jgi:hypothetical protein
MHESISEWWKKICRPMASFKEGWTVLTGTIVLTLKLSCLQKNKWGHTKIQGVSGWHWFWRIENTVVCETMLLIGFNCSTKTVYWGIIICKVHFLPTFITPFFNLKAFSINYLLHPNYANRSEYYKIIWKMIKKLGFKLIFFCRNLLHSFYSYNLEILSIWPKKSFNIFLSNLSM